MRTPKDFIQADEVETKELKAYFLYCLRKVCDGMDMIDMVLGDDSLAKGQKEIKNKRIIGPSRQAVGNYTKIMNAIDDGDIIIRKDLIKKFKREGNDGKNINSKKPIGSGAVV